MRIANISAQGFGNLETNPSVGHSRQFTEVLDKVGREMSAAVQAAPKGADLFSAVQEFQTQLLSKHSSVQLSELLRLQMYANIFNVRVELLSKVAEGANNALRRLQNG
jgi:hypothetical protein